MSKLLKKIKDNSGETIAETLVALLIASLALVMLAGAISAATGIITRSSKTISDYYDSADNLAKMDVSTDGTVSISYTPSGTSLPKLSQSDIAVQYGANSVLKSNDPVVAFKLKEGAGGPTSESGSGS